MPREELAPVVSSQPLSELLVELAARMTAEQRGAFLAKMAAMDRQCELTMSSITLGRA